MSKDDHFFQSFKEWATKKYPGPPIGTPSDEEWKNLLELDSQYQYNGATASASGQEALDNELDDLLLDAM